MNGLLLLTFLPAEQAQFRGSDFDKPTIGIATPKRLKVEHRLASRWWNLRIGSGCHVYYTTWLGDVQRFIQEVVNFSLVVIEHEPTKETERKHPLLALWSPVEKKKLYLNHWQSRPNGIDGSSLMLERNNNALYLTTKSSRGRSAVMKMMSIVCLLLGLAVSSVAGEKSIYDHSIKTLEGEASSLGAHKGKVMLVVNVASKCGYTPQYEGLESLFQKFKDQGLVVCGFPCNQFGRQEPGTASEIREFCSTNYGVTFPMYEKVDVKGANQHPIYEALTGKNASFPGDVRWNFGKFLIGKDGKIIKRFGSSTAPLSSELVGAVEMALK